MRSVFGLICRRLVCACRCAGKCKTQQGEYFWVRIGIFIQLMERITLRASHFIKVFQNLPGNKGLLFHRIALTPIIIAQTGQIQILTEVLA